MVDWEDHIEAHPAIAEGRAVVRGTRLRVDELLGRLADACSLEDLLASTPGLTREGLCAAFAYASVLMREDCSSPYSG